MRNAEPFLELGSQLVQAASGELGSTEYISDESFRWGIPFERFAISKLTSLCGKYDHSLYPMNCPFFPYQSAQREFR